MTDTALRSAGSRGGRGSKAVSLTGSAALIAGLTNFIPNDWGLGKVMLLCFAPAAVEVLLLFWNLLARHAFLWIQMKFEEKREKWAHRKQQLDLEQAQAKVRHALDNPDLPEKDRQSLKIAHARAQKALAEHALKKVVTIVSYDATVQSNGSSQ